MPILRQGPKLHKLPTGQHLLLDAIWRKHGGLRAAAKKIGILEHQLNVWRKRGGVPLKHVRQVALALGVQIGALNFVAVTTSHGAVGSWADIVMSCGLDKTTETKVLKSKPPKI